MKKIFVALMFVMLPSFSLAVDFVSPKPPSFDQLNTINVPVMTTGSVGVYGAKIFGQEGSKIKVSFDLVNSGKIQPQVKYSVSLLNKIKLGNILEDEKMYEEVLSLSEKETIHKEIEYTAPDYLKGERELWINVLNQNSFPLGATMVGKVVLTGSGEFVEVVSGTCYLTVFGEKEKKYTTLEGVDISKTEELFANCELKNNFKKSISIKPVFELYWKTTRGKLLSSNVGELLILKAGEKKKISYKIPTAKDSQSYDSVLFFKDEADNTVSNKAVFHYVVQGISATIQNLRLNKDYYSKGETAVLSLFWTPSADISPSSRLKGGSSVDVVTAEVVVKNSEGIDCSDVSISQLQNNQEEAVLNVSITSDCVNPTVSVLLKDLQGNVLDQSLFNIDTESEITKDESTINYKSIVMYCVVGLLFLSVLGYVFFRMKKKDIPTAPVIALMFFVFGAIFFGKTANASTWEVWGYNHGGWSLTTYTSQLNKTAYQPGEMIIASGTGSGGYCTNGWSSIGEYAYDPKNGALHTLFVIPGNQTWHPIAGSGSAQFSAPTVPGNYSVTFAGFGLDADPSDGLGTNGNGWGSYSEPFRVIGCGDGVVDAGEDCDSGSNNGTCTQGKTCSTSCTLNDCPYCGDGNKEDPEECDLGDATHGDGNGACPKTCDNNCAIKDCSVCGDGVEEGAEECDLGTDSNGECPKTCNASCRLNIGCCTAIELISATIVPGDVVAGGSYNVYCDYGEVIEGAVISVTTGSGACTGPTFVGTKAKFDCLAGSEGGDFPVSCMVNQIAPSNKCASSDSIEDGVHVVIPVDMAQKIDCAMPSPLYAGQSFTATIKMGNNGAAYDNTWKKDVYSLKTTSANWGKTFVDLATDVTPGYPAVGHQYSFTGTFTAPVSGDYSDFIWQMFNGTDYFGDQNNICGNKIIIQEPTFSLVADSKLVVEIPDSQIGTANSTTVLIRVEADPGFTNTVNLAITGVSPAVTGFTSTFIGGASLIESEYISGRKFYVTIPNDTAPGFRKVSVVGTTGSITKEVLVDLEVINPSYVNK